MSANACVIKMLGEGVEGLLDSTCRSSSRVSVSVTHVSHYGTCLNPTPPPKVSHIPPDARHAGLITQRLVVKEYDESGKSLLFVRLII